MHLIEKLFVYLLAKLTIIFKPFTMKHFKPYVNLIHYKNTGQYVLNALINLPSEYSVIDQKQQKVDNNWVVSLFSKEAEIYEEFKKS